MIEAIRDLPKVCKHLHLPVQSGSTRVLARMRRRHTRERYLALIDEIRTAVSDVALSTDMIVGFPGETPEDFEQTLSLTETVRYHSMFSFKYSERPNTLARARMPDDVPEPEKADRLAALQALQQRIQHELHESAVGRTVTVLADTPSRRRAGEYAGRTSGNTVVNFPGNRTCIGRLLDVRIERAGPNSLWGTPSPAVEPQMSGDGVR
jgi:tRNA-2-methylthio-N6-dimethylallyladenosine synthase